MTTPILRPRVLVTGAAGKLGSCLWPVWEHSGNYDLTLTDIRPMSESHSRILQGDLLDHDFSQQICVDQDVVVALAFIPNSGVSFDCTERNDIAMNLQLFESCRRAGVKKLVFASSNHVTGWNERIRQPPFVSDPNEFNPTGWYGAMKGMAEIAGKSLVNTASMRFIGIRIGFFNGESQSNSLRDCQALLAPEDAIQLFSLAIDYEGPEKAIITYGTSETGNTSNLDISPAKHILGYQPKVDLVSQRVRFGG